MKALRRKITVGYAVIALLVIGLSVFSFLELRFVAGRIAEGEHIGEFFNVTLEIRRFEKNYFLYRQESDLGETRAYLAQGQALLRDNPDLFTAIAGGDGSAQLAADLERYGRLLTDYGKMPGNELLAADIRALGKQIVTLAEAMASTERKALQSMLDRHRNLMIAAVAVVVLLVAGVGRMLIGNLHRILHEMELRQRQMMRAEKLAALGTLLSGVAHEINNPLSNISTSCEILAEELASASATPKVGPGGTAFHKELLDQIDAETWRARRIVRSLLDYARDREFRRERLPLAELVEETLRLVRGRTPAEVALHVQVPADLFLSGDRQRIQQVLINLVGNAIEATGGAGEIAIAARSIQSPWPADTLIFGRCPAEGIEIVVSDDGQGIAPETLPRIFDPFFTTKAVGHGLGLGLFIVFEIVEEHGGCIAVESAIGRGTSFRLRLPAEAS